MTAAKPPLTYRDAGVDIDAGNALVDRIKPLVRRSFAAFSASERHDLGQRARRGRQSGLGTASANTGTSAGTGTDVDADRAALAIPLLRLILGIPA